MQKEKRKSRRIPYKSDAEMISAGQSYIGSVQNISGEGLEYILTSFNGISEDFIPEKNIELVFRTPAGKKFKLNCEVKWYLRNKVTRDSLKLGMKIISPPPQYIELFEILRMDK